MSKQRIGNMTFSIALLVSLMGCDNPTPEEEAIDVAWKKMRYIDLTLDMYQLDQGHTPSIEQGLEALVWPSEIDPKPITFERGGYMAEHFLFDPWGNAYVYRKTRYYGRELVSLGPDGLLDTADDLNSWEMPEHYSS